MSKITMEKIIEQARTSQTEFECAGQEVVDELITGLAWALIEPKTNHSLSSKINQLVYHHL